MNSKVNYYKEAKELYVRGMLNLSQISQKLDISTKTLSKWKSMEEKNWEEQRKECQGKPKAFDVFQEYAAMRFQHFIKENKEMPKDEMINIKNMLLAFQPKPKNEIVDDDKASGNFKSGDKQIICYKNVNVVTTKQLAEFYEVETDKITYNFNYNKDKYQEGKHYFKLQNEDLKEFKDNIGNSNVVESNAKILYLWTEKGTLYHAKSLNTDKAWDVYEMLVETYFDVKEKTEIKKSAGKQPKKAIKN